MLTPGSIGRGLEVIGFSDFILFILT